eukprot:TRINITY_DN93333_c0_g1_i1.p1 TRINITY_DN93333_c0_g1~~TRINITY_DN93333_c0_g1_i1.p1  ORF type:complete len:433 (+),score=116.72 TRINITY_DN93333_c0_g1_i1:122-1420(+)
MAAYSMGPATEAFLPWAGSAFEPVYQETSGALRDTFVQVTVVLHGSKEKLIALNVPSKLTCADLKGHLAVEGVVSTCGGLEVSLEEGDASAPVLDDTVDLLLSEGQVVHVRKAASLVSITALATGGGARVEDEVYELVVPGETTGLLLRLAIEQATAGALRPAAVFLAETGCEEAAHAVADEEQVTLQDEQAVIVHREVLAVEEALVLPAPPAPVAPPTSAGKGLFSALKARLMRTKSSKPQGPPSTLCIRCASNVKVKGTTLSCTSKVPWSSCAIFDVPDPSFFEIGVQLLADAPAAEAEGLTGRWMLGLVPASLAGAVKTEAERKQLMKQGYFVTVCHGHPAKVHTPHMAYSTCGEDLSVLPGELKKGQTLTIRWASAGATISVQVDDCDLITLPYSPGADEEVRPCIVFGGKPAEVSVLQLGQEYLGGA